MSYSETKYNELLAKIVEIRDCVNKTIESNVLILEKITKPSEENTGTIHIVNEYKLSQLFFHEVLEKLADFVNIEETECTIPLKLYEELEILGVRSQKLNTAFRNNINKEFFYLIEGLSDDFNRGYTDVTGCLYEICELSEIIPELIQRRDIVAFENLPIENIEYQNTELSLTQDGQIFFQDKIVKLAPQLHMILAVFIKNKQDTNISWLTIAENVKFETKPSGIYIRRRILALNYELRNLGFTNIVLTDMTTTGDACWKLEVN